uniref:Nuclear cap-binding protein subunit 1 n=1 Tax=Setaria digitata TaxID=48799 RepID=A0A915PRD7_9BILA
MNEEVTCLVSPDRKKQEVIYHEDGRRFVDNKIENERSASNLWTTALACSVAHDLKERSNEDFTLRNLGFMRYGETLDQKSTKKIERYRISNHLTPQFEDDETNTGRTIFCFLNFWLDVFWRLMCAAAFMLIKVLVQSSRFVSLSNGWIHAVRGIRGATKQRFDTYKRILQILLGTTATGTTGLAVLPFLGKKSENYDISKESAKLERFIQEADTLYSVYLIENAYSVLRRFSSGNDPQMLWRLARILCEKAKMSQDKDDRKRFMYDALKMAEKALDNEGEQCCWEAHKWYGIVLSYVSEYEGTRQQVRHSFEVRKHLEKALDLNSTDATTWHALGVWFFTYADLSPWKALIVKALFGSVPTATYEDALRCFQKAEFISPNVHSSNLWYLAEVKSRLGEKEEAFELYKAAFKMPIVTMDDGDTHDKDFKMSYLQFSGYDRRRRADDEESDWCHKKRRGIPEKSESEIRLELLISRIGEKSSSSMESNLESLAQLLETDLITDMGHIIDIIIQCVCCLPEEITAYSTLVGLLNSKKQKFGFELLHQLLEVLREKLKSADFIPALHVVTFLADLVNCHVVSSSSLVEFYESFMEAACEESIPQARSDWFVYAVLHSLPWAGPELNGREKEPLDNLLEGVDKYMLERDTSHAKLLQVWSAMEHEQEEYLDSLWAQISKLRDDGWVERHISRYYIAFDGSLAGAVTHNLPLFAPPPHMPVIVYPLPTVVFRFFDYADCPDGGPVLPGAHSIERFLIEEELCSIIGNNCFNRKECAAQLVNYRKKAMVPINYMILEVIFSQLFRLPHPPLRPLFYGSLMIELCKTKDMPQVIAQAAELFYQRIDTMQLECIDRLIDWFSYHMSNFEYRWSWADWDDSLDLDDYAPRRYFVKEVIEKCMRFSYHERICDCLPSSFEEITPEKPSISFSINREEQCVKELVAELERAFRNKTEPKEVTGLLREFNQKHNGLTALSTFFAVMLNAAQKSFSHNFAALTRYHETLKELSDTDDESSVALLRTLYSVWKHNRQMMVVLITKMLRMTLLSANTVASWLLSHHVGQELHRFWLWEALFIVVKHACEHTNRCRNKLQQMLEKRSRMDLNDREEYQRFRDNEEDDDLGVILDDDIEMKKKEVKELQEILKNLFLNILHYCHELFEMKQHIDKELFVTAGIDPKILQTYSHFTALRA